jgi:hypothetical protein
MSRRRGPHRRPARAKRAAERARAWSALACSVRRLVRGLQRLSPSSLAGVSLPCICRWRPDPARPARPPTGHNKIDPWCLQCRSGAVSCGHSGWPGAGSNRRPSDFQSTVRVSTCRGYDLRRYATVVVRGRGVAAYLPRMPVGGRTSPDELSGGSGVVVLGRQVGAQRAGLRLLTMHSQQHLCPGECVVVPVSTGDVAAERRVGELVDAPRRASSKSVNRCGRRSVRSRRWTHAR